MSANSKRGRPRSERARLAILDAGCELLLTLGLADVSVDQIAEHACVSKATIYRWWPSKETLALDAVYHEWAAATTLEDTGSVTADLLALIGSWVGHVKERPYGRVIAALIAKARTDPEFEREYWVRLMEPRRQQAQTIFNRAVDRGDLPPNLDLEAATDLLYGPLYHRMLHGHAPLDDAFLRTVIDHALLGLLPRRPTSRGSKESNHV